MWVVRLTIQNTRAQIHMAAKRKRVTLNEFKAWLEGVEELQDATWTPSATQWKLIRAKIDNIKELPVAAVVPAIVATPQLTVPGVVHPGTFSVPPPIVGGIPAGQVVDMSPEAKALLNTSASGKSVTPDIDTTNGQYASGFG